MAQDIPTGFITKKQASDLYRRSHRQLTRDISKAITAADEKVLAHVALHTDDGTVREGSDVTLELIEELRVGGHSPMWLIQEEWLRETFGLKSEPPPVHEPEPAAPPPPPPTPQSDQSTTEATPSSAAEPKYVATLEQQVADLKTDKTALLKLVEELTENQKQSNVLMRNLHELLADRQGILLPKGEQSSAAVNLPTTASSDAKTVNAEVVTSSSKPQPTKKRQPSAKSKQGTKPRSRSPKSKKQAPAKWYQVPTLNRFLGR
ncbi:MAG: hypothetical protein KDA93_17790 [Planctomycetaceae bacterium]|nr:hypothetical protein [Planctomycetaceae bacterium]